MGKVKFLQLAQEIAGRHGLTLETYGITDQTYDYVEQNNLADFAFFQNRCTLEARRFWCMTQAGRLRRGVHGKPAARRHHHHHPGQ